MAAERWKDEPEEHDFPAGAAYLSLVYPDATVAALVAALQAAPTVERKAKDLLRASGLPALPADNRHVAGDLDKVRGKVKLSPVLLVRGDADAAAPLLIADGYHRVCASYLTDENSNVSCRIVDRRATA
jgi:hypothetical protein